MSIKLMSLVWELDLPPGEKLVLLALADQANDEGVQCWPSVATIARRSGQGERTVRRAFGELEKKGHLTRHHRDGGSTQYHVHPCQIGTPAKSAPLPKTTDTPANLAPKPSRTTNTKKDKPSSRARAKPKVPLPDGWGPKPLTPGTVCDQIVARWEPGRLERELSKFRDHHLRADQRWSDWDAAWRTWIQRAGEFERKRFDERDDQASGVFSRLVAAGIGTGAGAGEVPGTGRSDLDDWTGQARMGGGGH